MRRPNGFYQAVMNKMPGIKLSKSLIAMVKTGRRKNDAVLMAIIEVDHEMNFYGKGTTIL